MTCSPSDYAESKDKHSTDYTLRGIYVIRENISYETMNNRIIQSQAKLMEKAKKLGAEAITSLMQYKCPNWYTILFGTALIPKNREEKTE